MHGINGNPCSIRWIVRYLAGKGFVVIDVYREPTDADPSTPAIDKPDMSDLTVAHAETKLHRAALLSAVNYLRSPNNGYAKIINGNNLSLVGHSLGAVAVTLLQGQIPRVRATVQMDNLKRYAIGDLGSAFNCQPPRQLQVVPKAPSLGFANGSSCLDFDPTSAAAHNKNQKLPGFRWWKGHKKSAMELVMDGFVHDDFTGSGTDQQLKMVGYYTLNWLTYFARHRPAAGQNLLDPTPLGRPLSDVLSHAFHSALYAPGLKVCQTPLLSCL
jgi:pimeloyl-ACP methyl ester carboxylesterase